MEYPITILPPSLVTPTTWNVVKPSESAVSRVSKPHAAESVFEKAKPRASKQVSCVGFRTIPPALIRAGPSHPPSPRLRWTGRDRPHHSGDFQTRSDKIDVSGMPTARRLGNRRHSRLETCATTESGSLFAFISSEDRGRNPVGVDRCHSRLPRVARRSQPRALLRNPVGIEDTRNDQTADPSGFINN